MGKRKREKLLQRQGKALQEKLKAWEEMDDDDEEVVQPTTQKSGNTKAQSLKRPPPPPRPPQESSEEEDDDDEGEDEDGEDDEDFHLEMGGNESGEEGALESEEGSSIGDDFDGEGEDEDEDEDEGEDGDEGSDIDDDGQESYDEDMGSDAERVEEPPAGKDGMADMMAKILNQDVTTKVPVLAKRNTKLMKDMETQKKASKDAREAAAKKRAALNHQLYTPDHTQVESEKQLRKIATRGVVALFNAISKARATAQAEAEGATTKKIKTSSGKIVKPGEISKKDFLDLLKSSSKGPEAESGNDTAGAGLGGGASGGGWAGVKDDLLVKTPKMNTYDDGMSEDEAGLDDEEDGVPMDEDDDDSEGGGGKMAARRSEKPKAKGDGKRKSGGGRGRRKTRHLRGGKR